MRHSRVPGFEVSLEARGVTLSEYELPMEELQAILPNSKAMYVVSIPRVEFSLGMKFNGNFKRAFRKGCHFFVFVDGDLVQDEVLDPEDLYGEYYCDGSTQNTGEKAILQKFKFSNLSISKCQSLILCFQLIIV